MFEGRGALKKYIDLAKINNWSFYDAFDVF